MTLNSMNQVWVGADMTENNLGHVQPGTPVAIVLDALPGETFEGRVRSVGYGVSTGQSTPPGALPTIQNSRDWLRPAQRFPVIVDFAPAVAPPLRAILIGGRPRSMHSAP